MAQCASQDNVDDVDVDDVMKIIMMMATTMMVNTMMILMMTMVTMLKTLTMMRMIIGPSSLDWRRGMWPHVLPTVLLPSHKYYT